MPRNSDDEDRKLYSERPEWADVTPVPQYQGLNPIAPIFYTPQYKDATEYFRGVISTGEKSERVLELTEAIIRMNPAHYTAWQYRYQTLIALKSPLDLELKLMDGIAIQFLKTYQVWHHRRLLLTALHDTPSSSSSQPAALAELAFISRVLMVDSKNYHTWSYRQWLLSYFDDVHLWTGEISFVERLLEEDVRNNSAWHHRFFVVFGRGQQQGEEDRPEVLKRELGYTKDQISLAPNNPSAWNYLRGILEQTKTPFSNLESFVQLYVSSEPPKQDILDLENPAPGESAELPCVAALEFLADIHEQAGADRVQKAIEIWKSLGDKYDTMRKKYWEYRIREALASS
ncbi:protein prenyltransferase subunit alpha family protein [Abortiporus biennis]